jgi:hypothetical protein
MAVAAATMPAFSPDPAGIFGRSRKGPDLGSAKSAEISLMAEYLLESFSDFNLSLYPLFTVKPQNPQR